MPLGGCFLFPQPGFGASTGASGLRHNLPRGEAGSGCPRPPCRRPAMDACKSDRVEWPFPKAHPAVSGFRSLPSQQWNVHGIPHNSSSVCWQDWCTNPANKLKNYYVGSHARSIVGWGGIESRKLLDELLERATQPDLIYRHPWQVGDTVVWDNRCLLHRGAGYDANRWRRLMRQTRVAGKGNTLQEA